jgi:endonuclease/exonuclease/phosphatase family metal-dependent hydrolase
LVRRRELIFGAASAPVLACGSRGRREASPAEGRSNPEPAASPEPDPPASLRVLSYNVLADEVALDRRIPALLRTMQAAQPDLIALQEVAPWFLDWIAGSEWLAAFELATIDGRPARPNGQLILSRLPIASSRARRLAGRQGRTVLISQIELGGGERLALATTHMESFLEDGPIRARQLDEIFAELARERDDPRVSATVLAGDLNFGEGEQPDTAHIDAAFVDLWTALRPDEPGYTWDIEHSEMARAGSFVGEPSRRLDRILLRSRSWVPAAIEIIGDRGVAPGDRSLFPSDHFGLVGEIRYAGGREGRR